MQVSTVESCPRGGGSDANEGDEREDYGEEGHIEDLPFHAYARVAGEIGLVDGEGGIVA